MLDVVIAVREPLQRIGLEAALKEAETVRVAEVVDDVSGLEDTLSGLDRAVVILDVHYRRADHELVPRIVREYPDVRVLVLVAHGAEDCAARHVTEQGDRVNLSFAAMCDVDECCLASLRNQAHGCLPREIDAGEVVRAVERVAAGDVVADAWMGLLRLGGVNRPSAQEPPSLTPRELDVMGCLAKGLGNKAIGRKLGIKEQTVKNYVARIMSKTGLSNRVQVGLIAARYRLQNAPESD